MARREYDESDARVRPTRRGSRPRSKVRPDHAGATAGRVILIDRGRITVQVGQSGGTEAIRTLTAVKARELGRRSLVVGDRVWVVGDTSGRPDTLSRIVGLDPRRTSLRRSAEDVGGTERVIVANADLMGIVVATTEPAPRLGFIDRCLIAAYDGGLQPLLIITKTDLAPASVVTDTYRALDVDGIPVRRDQEPHAVREALSGLTTVLIGQSGVGKSTLVNLLVPQAERTTGHVNETTGRGRHTSTSVQAMPLPEGGWIIDTPGIRSFGLAHVDIGRVLQAFSDFGPAGESCPRGCNHLDEHCALDAFVASGGGGGLGAERLASLRRMLAARDAELPGSG